MLLAILTNAEQTDCRSEANCGTLEQLPVDVLRRIISCLRAPLPSPTGSAVRKDIRQTKLAKLMRVSKSFYRLAGPELYRTVITDNLPSFTFNISASLPVKHPITLISGIPSKLQLVQGVRRLHIELAAHQQVCREFAITRHWDVPVELDWEGRLCGEIDDGIRAMELLRAVLAEATARISLQAMTFSTFLVPDAEYGLNATLITEEVNQKLIESRRVAVELCQILPVRHVCERAAFGPYTTVDDGTFPAPTETSTGPRTFAVHSKTIPASLHKQSQPSRTWYIEGGPMALINYTANYLTAVHRGGRDPLRGSFCENLGSILSARVLDYARAEPPMILGNRTLAVYADGSSLLPQDRGRGAKKEQIRQAADDLNAYLVRVATTATASQGEPAGTDGGGGVAAQTPHALRVTVDPIWEAPPCLACGWHAGLHSTATQER